jgi:hypothetical protein
MWAKRLPNTEPKTWLRDHAEDPITLKSSTLWCPEVVYASMPNPPRSDSWRNIPITLTDPAEGVLSIMA